MKTTDYIKLALENSKGWAQGLLFDIKDAPLTQPTSDGGNHPLWVIGHLAYSESTLLDVFIKGEANRFAEWEGLFGAGSTPTADASRYASFDELMGKFEEMRQATLAYLATLTDEDLDRATGAPEEFGAAFGTVGACYAAMSTHVAFHAGQVADARRAIGRSPLMM